MEFLSLKGDYTGSSESSLVKMPHCWKLHVAAQIYLLKQAHTMPYAAYRPEENFIDNYTSQAKHRWLKRLTHVCKKLT